MNEIKEKIDWKRLAITVGIVLVTATVVGGTVWYLMDQNAKSIADSNRKSFAALEKQVSKSQETEISKKTGEETTRIDSNFNLYKNFNLGFEIKVPKEAYFGSASCAYIAANGDHSYRTSEGLLPTKVITDGDSVYITQEYFYHLTGETKSGDNVSYYSGCEKVAVTAAVLKDSSYWEPVKWNINIKTANTDTRLASLIQEAFGPGCSLGEKKVTSVPSMVSVTIKGDGLGLEATKCPINYATALFYDQARSKFAYWVIGQAETFYKNGMEGGFGSEMEDSFRFI